jgi:cell division protein FtsL
MVAKKKAAMMEVHTVKRIDNSRLVRHVEPVKMRKLYRTAALGMVAAFFCMLYVYQHFRCIDLSFQLEDVKGKREAAMDLNNNLRLDIATLRDPKRIDYIAQHKLGLQPATPGQVREYQGTDDAEVAAARLVRVNRMP